MLLSRVPQTLFFIFQLSLGSSEIDGEINLFFDRRLQRSTLFTKYPPAENGLPVLLLRAGSVPTIMEEIKDMLHLDVMTVTGKTLGENLEELKRTDLW